MNIKSITVAGDTRTADKGSTNLYNILIGGKDLEMVLNRCAYKNGTSRLMLQVNLENGSELDYTVKFDTMGNWPSVISMMPMTEEARVLVA